MFELKKPKKLKSFPIISLLVVIGFTVIILADRNGDVVFQFPEYDYKETSKNVTNCSDCLLICSDYFTVDKYKDSNINLLIGTFIS